MRADSSEFFTQPPRIINRLPSSLVIFLEICAHVASQVVYIQYPRVFERRSIKIMMQTT